MFSTESSDAVLRFFPNDRLYITLGKALFMLLMSRQKAFFRDSENATRMTKRVVHTFCQCIQMNMEKEDGPLLRTCPEPSKCASYHPIFKHSRQRGSTVLKQSVFQRFTRRSSGFLSTKEESSLMDLGVLPSGSKLATATAGEFMIRFLAKTSQIARSRNPPTKKVRFLVWCMDAARACRHQAG